MTSSPVRWSGFGALSRIIAQGWQPSSPPVLVLSLPRSGSSWVGEVMGSATNALYLREPLSQGNQRFRELGTVFPITAEVANDYAALADKAFAGWPDFPHQIVNFPQQWKLQWRRPRRVVIKEVNPLAMGWFVERYRPKLIYLIRHPAAVALSWQNKGWIEPTPDAWHAHATYQATITRDALAQVDSNPSAQLAIYEQICRDPMAQFEQLFGFANLIWDQHSISYTQSRSGGQRGDDKWATSRNTVAMIDAWKAKVNPDCLNVMRDVYLSYGLNVYDSAESWQLP